MSQNPGACLECGAALAPDATECTECGFPVLKQEPASGAAGAAAPEPRAPKPEKPRPAPRPASHGSRSVNATILGVSLTVAAVVLFLLYLQRLPRKGADAGEETQANNGRMPTADATADSGAGAPAQGGMPGAPPLPADQGERMKMLHALVERDSTNPTHLVALANELYDAGQFAEASQFYQKMLRLDAGNADARVDYATCLFQSGKAEDAAAQLQIVLKNNPHHANALYNLGVIESAAGRKDDAVRHWEQYLQYNPGAPHADELKQRLATLKK